MTQLEFSCMSDLPVEEQLKKFQAQTIHKVNFQHLNWDSAWNEIIRVAIHREWMDVAEVGTTWPSDLRELDVLHTFTSDEVSSLGGAGSFLPASWATALSPVDGEVWAIPWILDTRLLYYRRDMLEKAGIDPATAFESDAALKATLQTLLDQGHPCPLAIPTRHSRMILHTVASWVWGTGGDILSPDGTSACFARPETLEGFYQYFDLHRFLTPEATYLDGRQSDALFWRGKAAVTISGPWLRLSIFEAPATIGFTFPPGMPFVGGSNLILWRQSADPKSAMELIRFLTSPEFQSTQFPGAGYFPSRLSVLSQGVFSEDPCYRFLSQRLQHGRSFRPARLWGLAEERLCATLYHIWEEIFAHRSEGVGSIVEQNLTTLARRLDLTLKG